MIPLDSLTSIHALLASLLSAIDKDAVNGGFEVGGGFFMLNHCRVLHAHKSVRGVSMLSSLFFLTWGVWNLYYYPALNQPVSFYGALFITAASSIYIAMMLHYRRREVLGLYEHAIYLGAESAGYSRNGDQA